MIYKTTYSYLTNEEPESFSSIEKAIQEDQIDLLEKDEEQVQNFYEEIENNDFLGTTD